MRKILYYLLIIIIVISGCAKDNRTPESWIKIKPGVFSEDDTDHFMFTIKNVGVDIISQKLTAFDVIYPSGKKYLATLGKMKAGQDYGTMLFSDSGVEIGTYSLIPAINGSLDKTKTVKVKLDSLHPIKIEKAEFNGNTFAWDVKSDSASVFFKDADNKVLLKILKTTGSTVIPDNLSYVRIYAMTETEDYRNALLKDFTRPK